MPSIRHFSQLQSLTRSSLLTAALCFAASAAPSALADDHLQGHVRETTGSTRLVRPTLGISGGTTAQQFGTGLKDTVDNSNFDLKANASKASMRCEIPTWNSWPAVQQQHLFGNASRSLLNTNAYRSPILTGNISDLGAVERAWKASKLIRTKDNQRSTVSVSLAMCPSNDFRENWNILMRELAQDGDDGKWRRFQDAVCAQLMNRLEDGKARGILSGPVNISQHVALKATGEIIYGAGQQQQFVDARNFAVQSALEEMNLHLPPGTGVSEVHFRIQLNQEPAGVPHR